MSLHWPSVRGRGRRDLGPLLLAAVIVAVVGALGAATPGLLRGTADRAVRDAVSHSGEDADVVVRAPWEPDDGPTGGRRRAPNLAADLDDLVARATDALGPGLDAVLRPPIAAVTTSSLKVIGGSAPCTFQLAYLSGAAVVWTAGTPPGPANGTAVTATRDASDWPVQIGLSEADAQVLGAAPGAAIDLLDSAGTARTVTVSGVFRPADPRDPAWRLAPGLLAPAPGADGVGTTRLGGLLTRDSLPDARLAFDADQLQRSVHFAPDPAALTWATAQDLTATVVALKAASGSSSALDTSLRWDTQLDSALRRARGQVAAATAQAAVVLVAVLTATVLILLLAADLLVRRRAPDLTAARHRGAGLPTLGAELLLESATVAALSLAAGLAAARALTPDVSWPWAVPVAVTAALAAPALGTVVAWRATAPRRRPANRSARRWAARTRLLHRAALETLVLLLAVAAFVALHQRGLVTEDGLAGAAGLPASAPALGALAGALALVRLLPAATALALRRALRSRRPLAVFGAARAADTAGRLLPPLALAVATALAAFTATVAATAERGLEAGAWSTVGADARLDVAPAAAASTPELARRIAAAPGVHQAVAAQITDRARIVADSLVVAPRLVVVDAAAFQRLLAATPLPAAPQLALLVGPSSAAGVPALVRSANGGLRPGMALDLLRENAPSVRLAAVGDAPAVGDADDVVIVDAGALAAAGMPVEVNTVWAVGPGAASAVTGNAVAAGAVLRADVLRERRAAPLTAGLLRLARAATVLLAGLALLALALGAAAGAPQRWQTLTRLRTLGLRPRDARRVALGELLPPVVLAVVGAGPLGLLVARLATAPLALRLLTAEADDPSLVAPWWTLVAVALVLLAALAVTAPAESALRRRRRLAEVLRAGER